MGSNLILDATAFYAGIAFQIECFTTSMVLEEIRHIKKAYDIIGSLVGIGKVRIVDPSPIYIERARDLARRSGDLSSLSEADLSILALAMEFHDMGKDPEVITDDYALMNILKLAKIRVSKVMSRGIRYTGRWIKYCPACKVSYPASERICNRCGNKLRRKLI